MESPSTDAAARDCSPPELAGEEVASQTDRSGDPLSAASASARRVGRLGGVVEMGELRRRLLRKVGRGGDGAPGAHGRGGVVRGVLAAAAPDGERLVLVGHSLGGLSLALAMERFPRKVAAAVFLVASMPCVGRHMGVTTEEVKDVRWNSKIGNVKMEMRPVNYFADQFNKQLGKGVDIRQSPKAMAKLKKQVKCTKEILSVNTAAPISVESLYNVVDSGAL